jgi:formylglycine-generating enzyme required for sulfatase activity
MKKKINKGDLDKLLNQSLLSSNAGSKNFEHALDAMSAHAMSGSFIFALNIAFAIKLAVTALLACAVVFSIHSVRSDERSVVSQTVQTPPEEPVKSAQPAMIAENDTFTAAPGFTRYPKARPVHKKAVVVSRPVSEMTLFPHDTVEFTEVKKAVAESPEEYVFPVLTENEKKQNEKEKRRLLRLVSRVTRDKDRDIARIPASADGSIPAFYMGAGEVTNKEYRTFLFDLLINDRKEEFLKAKPKQQLWKNVENTNRYDFLQEVYFCEKKYDIFPVVNITIEGAEMYCLWLREELIKMKLNDSRIPDLEVRLPYLDEWMHAAKGGSIEPLYPWPLNSIQNRSNCFMANFCVQKKKDLIRHPVNYGKHVIDLNNYTSAAVFLRDPGIATIDVWSYNPTSYGLFGMSGNAAEMVYSGKDKNVLTKGGSWASDLEELQIHRSAEIPPAHSSPMMGFRICVFVKSK